MGSMYHLNIYRVTFNYLKVRVQIGDPMLPIILSSLRVYESTLLKQSNSKA